jgi:hypothetical protein
MKIVLITFQHDSMPDSQGEESKIYQLLQAALSSSLPFPLLLKEGQIPMPPVSLLALFFLSLIAVLRAVPQSCKVRQCYLVS